VSDPQYKVVVTQNFMDENTKVAYYNGDEHLLDPQEAQFNIDAGHMAFVEEVGGESSAAQEEPQPAE
jgi:hypothetical protein